MGSTSEDANCDVTARAANPRRRPSSLALGGLAIAALVSSVVWTTALMLVFRLAGMPLSTTALLLIAGGLGLVTGVLAAPLFLARTESED